MKRLENLVNAWGFVIFTHKMSTIYLDANIPLWLSWKRICLQCGSPWFNPWVGRVTWRRKRLPTPVFWPGKFHGLYSPWGRKESDTTELLSLTLPNLEPVCCTMSSSNCCFLICIQISQEAGQVFWYSHLLKNFPVRCDPHSQRLCHSQ